MKVTQNIEEARKLLDDALESMADQDTKIQALPDDAPDEERTFHAELFESRKEDVKRARETLERLIALRDAREAAPPAEEATDDDDEPEVRHARAKGTTKEPLTYRERGQFSFFQDLYRASIKHDPVAHERLAKHQREMDHEMRALTTTATAGGNFVPPVYLGAMYAEMARPGRPFADVVPSSPLMASGMSITIPRITTGTAVTAQTTQNTSIGTTDIVEALLTVPVVTIAGYEDLSVQLFDRSEPGMDQIIFNDLRQDYDQKLDSAMLSGAGTTTHVGIRAVSSINTVTYTSSTPTAAGLVPKIYDGIQKIATARYAAPDTVVAHPRRTAWLASNLSSTFPLFQLGALNQAAGTQAGGFTNNIAGLRVVDDANIGSTYGTGTNEDEVYVARVADMHLWEGPLQAEVFRDVGSANATVRIRLLGYSAFASGRFPASITKISGTGLAAPTF